MSRNSTWTNADGLVVGFGTHTVDNGVPSVTAGRGSVKTMTFKFNGIDLVTTGSVVAGTQLPQSAVIRRGSIIQRAKLQTVVAFTSGGAATLSIGTFKDGAAGTVDVAAGISSALAITTIDAVGETVVCAGTLVNGTIPLGATSDSDVVVIPSWGTAAFTAGSAVLTIEYIEPQYDATLAV